MLAFLLLWFGVGGRPRSNFLASSLGSNIPEIAIV